MSQTNESGLRASFLGWSLFLRSANRFFFAPSDTATFGLIRIAAGLMAFYVHLVYCYDLQELFGKNAWLDHATANAFRLEVPVELPALEWQTKPPDLPPPATREERLHIEEYRQKWGYDPRVLHAQGQYVWSVYYHITDPQWMMVFHIGVLVVMLLFALGLWTPVTGTLTWLGALCYVNRSHVSLFGMDTMMIIALFYLAAGSFLLKPSASALSLDRLIWRWRATRQGLKEEEHPETTSVSANFAIRMMQIHFCIIYFAAGVSKLLGASWWNGTALWWCMANYEFAPMNQPGYMDFLIWLCQHRLVWELVMTFQAVYTLTLEVGFPFLVWNRRLRWLMVVLAVFLHTGIAVLMGLTGFGVMMLTLLLSFVPPETVRQLLGLAAARAPRLAPAPVP